MKFKGKLIDVASIGHFLKILATISKLVKHAALRITPTHIYFVFSERCGGGKSQLWCELPQKNFFSEFQLTGYSEDFNEICLELLVEYLATAFRSAVTAKSVRMKLVKKHCACLSIEIDLPSAVLHSNHSRTVLHDVPVQVVPRKYLGEFKEPEMPEIDVSVFMPSLKVVKNVVDRMKNISSFLIISADLDGRFMLKVVTDTVDVSTHFENVVINTNNAVKENVTSPAEVRVDIRKVSQLLYGQAINPDEVICNIADNWLVQFFFINADVTLQFVLPNISA